jgi:hypothetical protein
MKVLFKKIIFYLLLSIGFIVQAQPPLKFYCRYGGNGYDVGYDLKQTLDKGYIITGSTSSFGQGNTDLYLLKLDSMGQKQFETSFGGYSNEIGKSVVQLADSSYVMVGYTSSSGVGGYDVFFVKADKTGNVLWQKTFGGSDWDFAYSLDTTADGGFIIAGTSYSFGYGSADGYIIKTDGNGNLIWTKSYGGKYDDEFKSVIQTTDGNYALTGYTKSYNDSLGDSWVFKVDVNGDSLWSKYYGGNKEDFSNQIIELNTGDYIIAGATESYGSGLLDGYALKINSSGNIISTLVKGTASFSEIYTAVAISQSNAGNKLCFSQKEDFFGFGVQVKIIEYDFDFTYLNASDYGSVNTDETYSLISTKDKGYAAVGCTNGFSAALTDCYFIKTDSLIYNSPSIVSLNDLHKEIVQFNIFPNPSQDYLNIQFNDEIDEKLIKLCSLTGEELNIKGEILILSNNRVKINTADFNEGIYFLKYGSSTRKVIITN